MDQPVEAQPWDEPLTRARKVIDHNARHYRNDCAVCVEVEANWTKLEALLTQANTWSNQVADVERTMRGLQEEFHGIRHQVTMAARAMKHHVGVHARCPLCGGLVGKEHAHGELVREPNGPDVCCAGCARNLTRWGSTIAQERINDQRKIRARESPNGVPR